MTLKAAADYISNRSSFQPKRKQTCKPSPLFPVLIQRTFISMGASLKSMFDISFQHNHPATGMPSSAKPPSLAPCHEPSNEKQCDQEGTHTASPTEKPSKVSFLSLPTEIHLEISSHLIYPDALSLKHANRYFYNIINTGIELKIDWLISRRKLHLECPNNKGCDLGSDLRFCRGSVAYVFCSRYTALLAIYTRRINACRTDYS